MAASSGGNASRGPAKADMHVRYFNEFKWVEDPVTLAWLFRDDAGESVAEVALHNAESKMWRFVINVPERYRLDGALPGGLVHSAAAAKKVCELVLSYTILTR